MMNKGGEERQKHFFKHFYNVIKIFFFLTCSLCLIFRYLPVHRYYHFFFSLIIYSKFNKKKGILLKSQIKIKIAYLKIPK